MKDPSRARPPSDPANSPQHLQKADGIAQLAGMVLALVMVVSLIVGGVAWLAWQLISNAPSPEHTAEAPVPAPTTATHSTELPPTTALSTNGLKAGLPAEAPPSTGKVTFTPHHRRTAGEHLYVLGELHHSGATEVAVKRLRGTLLNERGKEVGTIQSWLNQVLGPHEILPVSVFLSSPAPHATIRWAVETERAYALGRVEGLAVEAAAPQPSLGGWRVSGKVQHRGDRSAEGVSVRVVARDAADKVVGVETTYIAEPQLHPGQSARFSRTISTAVPPARYDYVAMGRPLAAPTAEATPGLQVSFTLHRTEPSVTGSLRILGMVNNESSEVVNKPKVTAVFLNAEGEELATRDGYAIDDLLLPQQSGPVHFYATDVPDHASVRFEAAARRPLIQPNPAQGLTLVPEQPRGEGDPRRPRFSGQVLNGGTDAAQFVKVRISGFDSDGKLVGVTETYARGKEPLAPKGRVDWSTTASFTAAPARVQVEVYGKRVR